MSNETTTTTRATRVARGTKQGVLKKVWNSTGDVVSKTATTAVATLEIAEQLALAGVASATMLRIDAERSLLEDALIAQEASDEQFNTAMAKFNKVKFAELGIEIE